jgi:hypothetical protein
MFLFVVHGHVHLIGGDWCCDRALMASHLDRGLHVFLRLGRSTPRGLDAPVLTLQGSGKAEVVPDRV